MVEQPRVRAGIDPIEGQLMNRVVAHIRLVAQPGQREALVEQLLGSLSDQLGSAEACEMFLVSRSRDDENVVWVTELWSSQDAHDGLFSNNRLNNEVTRIQLGYLAEPADLVLRIYSDVVGGFGPSKGFE